MRNITKVIFKIATKSW